MNARNRASPVFSLLPFSPAPFPLTLNVYALPLLFAIFFLPFHTYVPRTPFPFSFFLQFRTFPLSAGLIKRFTIRVESFNVTPTGICISDSRPFPTTRTLSQPREHFPSAPFSTYRDPVNSRSFHECRLIADTRAGNKGGPFSGIF